MENLVAKLKQQILQSQPTDTTQTQDTQSQNTDPIQSTVEDWFKYQSDNLFSMRSDEEKKSLTEAFDKTHPYGLDARAVIDQSDNSVITNLGENLIDSAVGTYDALRNVAALSTGSVDKNFGKRMAAADLRQRLNPASVTEQKALDHLTISAKKINDAKGVSETLKALLGAGEDLATETFNNPIGTAETFMRSGAYMVPHLIGAIGGEVLTGNPIGAAVGGFTGSMGTEVGTEYDQLVRGKLQKLHLKPTAENYQKIASDPIFYKKNMGRAVRKGATIGLADITFDIPAGKLASAGTKVARKEALKSLNLTEKMLSKLPEDAAENVAVAAKIAQNLKNQSIISKILREGGATAIETASEPAGEFASQVAEYKGNLHKVQTIEVLLEALAAPGAAIVHTPIAKALYGVKAVTKIASKIANKQNIVNNESINYAKNLRDSKANKGFNDKIKSIIETKDATEYSDPTNEKYDPIATVTALAELNKNEKTSSPKNLVDAKKVKNTFISSVNGIIDKLQTLSKIEPSKLTVADKKQETILNKQLDIHTETLKNINSIIDSMEAPVSTDKDLKTGVTNAINSNNPEDLQTSLIKVFGSKSAGNDLSKFIDFEKLNKSKNIPDHVKHTINQLKEYQDAVTKKENYIQKTKAEQNNKNNVTNQRKSSEEVHLDILSNRFKEKDSKHQWWSTQDRLAEIAKQMKNSNYKAANYNYNQMVKFLVSQTKKLTDYQAKQKPHDLIELEVNELHAARKIAEGMIGKKLKTNFKFDTESAKSSKSETVNSTTTQQTSNSKSTQKSKNTGIKHDVVYDTNQIPVSVSNTPIKVVKHGSIKPNNGRTSPIIMHTDSKGIQYAKSLLTQKFREHQDQTETPDLDGKGNRVIRPAKDIFKTEKEYEIFMLEHEAMHKRIKRKENENIADYENRVNLNTLNKLGLSSQEFTDAVAKAKRDRISAKTPDKTVTKQPSKNTNNIKSINVISDKTESVSDTTQSLVANQEEQKLKEKISQTEKELQQSGSITEHLLNTTDNSIKVFNSENELSDTDLANPEVIKDYNPLQLFFKAISPIKLAKSIATSAKGVIASMRELYKSKDTTNSEKKYLTALGKFHVKINSSIGSIFNDKKAVKYFSEHPINYFSTIDKSTGKRIIHPRVAEIVSAVSFNWLATRASSTLNLRDYQIRRMFGITNDETNIVGLIGDALSKVGVTTPVLERTLGEAIFDSLGLEPKSTNMPLSTKDELINALGSLALGAMEHSGFVEREHLNKNVIDAYVNALQSNDAQSQNILYGDDARLGVEKLLVNPEDKYVPGHKDPKTGKWVKESGVKVITTFQIPINEKTIDELFVEPHKSIQDIIDINKTVPNLYNRLFNPKDTDTLSFTKINHPKDENGNTIPEKLKGSSSTATVEQTENKHKNEDIAWVHSDKDFSIYQSLPEEMQLALFDVVSPKEIDNHHISERTSLKSRYRDLKRHIQNILTFRDMVISSYEKDGNTRLSDTPFYIRQEFIKNGRMQQTGLIQTENNKIDRAFFRQRSWNMKVPFSGKGKFIQLNHFKRAVAFHIGFEEYKESGKALQKFNEFMAEKVHKQAIKAMQVLVTDSSYKLSNEEKTAITETINDAGDKLVSFTALLEWARYLNTKAKKEDFITDIGAESDGAANGPALSFLQFTINPTKLKHNILKALGISFNPNTDNTVGRGTNLDNYQQMALYWAKKFNEIKADLIKKDKLSELKQVAAVESLLGSMYDKNGSMVKSSRKLTKNVIQGTLYGTGKEGVVRDIHENELIQKGIYGRLTEIVKSGDIEKLQQLHDTILQAAPSMQNSEFLQEIRKAIKSKKLKPLLELAIDYNLKQALYNTIYQYQGEALFQAVEHLYGDIRMSRKTLNHAVTIATYRYNAALLHLINKKKSEREANNQVMTVADVLEIEKSIEHLLPVSKSANGGVIPLYSQKTSTLLEGGKVTVTQFKQGTVEPIHGYTEYGKILSDPRVLGPIYAIHNLDAIIQNNTMGEAKDDYLAIHDAKISQPDKSGAISKIMNKQFYQVNKDTSISENIANMYHDSTTKFDNWVNENIDDKDKFNKDLSNMFKDSKINFNEDSKDSLYKQATESLRGTRYNKDGDVTQYSLAKIVKLTKKNKDYWFSIIHAINQYFDVDGNYTVRKGKVKSQMASENISLEAEQKEIENFIKNISAEQTNKIGEPAVLGSTIEGMSTNTEDYTTNQQVDNMNAVDVYDNLQQQESTDLFAKKDSTKHKLYLHDFLKHIVTNTMNPLDLFIKKSGTGETQGKYDARNKKAKIFLEQQDKTSTFNDHDIRMSSGETYAHELTHHIMFYGLASNTAFRDQIRTLFKLVRNQMKKDGITYEVFLDDPATATANEITAAKLRYAHVFEDSGNTFIGTNEFTGLKMVHRATKQYSEFSAFGVTNENFMNYIHNIKINKAKQKVFAKGSWSDVVGNSIQETLLNVFRKVVSFVRDNITHQSTKDNVGEQLQSLIIGLAHADSKAKTDLISLIQKATGPLSKANKAFYNYMDNKIKDIIKSTPVYKKIEDIKTVYNKIKYSDTILGKELRKIQNKIEGMDFGIIQHLVNEYTGNTKDLFKKYYALLVTRNEIIDKAKVSIMNSIRLNLQDLYSDDDITTNDKIAWTKAGLKTDLSSLSPHMKLKAIGELLSNPTANEDRITVLNSAITSDSELSKYSDFFRKATETLGYFMAHEIVMDNSELWFNAENIAHMMNTQHAYKLSDSAFEKVVPILDQLATLYALQHTDESKKLRLAALYKKDSEAFEGVLNLHSILKQKAQDELFTNTNTKFIKGYIKTITDPSIDIQLAPIEDAKMLIDKGYINLGPVSQDPKYKTNKMFIFKHSSAQSKGQVSGIMGLKANKAKGSSFKDIVSYSTDDIEKAFKRLNGRKQRTRNAMFNPNHKISVPERSYDKATLIPKLDDEGNITDYRYMMSTDSKTKILDQNFEYDNILGAMASSNLEKANTPVIGEKLLNELKSIYDEDYEKHPAKYLKISGDSVDPKIRDIYYKIPPKVRSKIKGIWGKNYFMIRKELINSAFGFDKYSISDIFGKSRLERSRFEQTLVTGSTAIFRSSDKALARLKSLEDLFKYLTKSAKNNIVVKAVTITIGNQFSNQLYLKARGVSNSYIAKYSTEATIQSFRYMQDKTNLDKLKLKRQMTAKRRPSSLARRQELKETLKRMDHKILDLENEISLNPTTKFIESGGMQQIVDDVNTQEIGDVYKNILDTTFEKVLNRLPKHLQTVSRNMLMTKDSALYQVANTGVKMTDFVSRYVLYKHYTQKEKMSHTNAMSAVIHEFVDFNIPTSRSIQYLNDIGAVWFSKYFIRILKVIKDSAVDKPFTALSTYMFGHKFGIPNIYNSIPGVTKNTAMLFGNPLFAFLRSLGDPVTIALAENNLF